MKESSIAICLISFAVFGLTACRNEESENLIPKEAQDLSEVDSNLAGSSIPLDKIDESKLPADVVSSSLMGKSIEIDSKRIGRSTSFKEHFGRDFKWSGVFYQRGPVYLQGIWNIDSSGRVCVTPDDLGMSVDRCRHLFSYKDEFYMKSLINNRSEVIYPIILK